MATPFDQHWEGGGNPTAGSNGWDISGLAGNLFIWFGAPGRYRDSATLNAGATAFYGLNGTGALPTGYVAWDPTGHTAWDYSKAQSTGIIGVFTDPAGVLVPIVAALGVGLTNSRLTATIGTSTDIISGTSYGTLWNTLDTYQTTAVCLDSQSTNYKNAFYFCPQPNGPSLNQPVGNVSWESAIAGVVSNTSKQRV